MIRVVVVSQTPLAVPAWCGRWPAALKNIAKEIYDDTGEHLTDGTLRFWEEQGVLVVNAREADGCTLEALPNVVIIALGKVAGSFAAKHCANGVTVLYTSHPGTGSVNRGFFGSKVFSRCNRYVKGDPIKWGKR